MSILDNRMRTFNCPTRFSRCENDFLVKGGTVYNSFVLIRDHGSPIDVDPIRQRRVEHVDWNTSRGVRCEGMSSFKRCSHNQSLHIALVKFILLQNSLITIPQQQRKILLLEQYFILNALNCERERKARLDCSFRLCFSRPYRMTQRGRDFFYISRGTSYTWIAQPGLTELIPSLLATFSPWPIINNLSSKIVTNIIPMSSHSDVTRVSYLFIITEMRRLTQPVFASGTKNYDLNNYKTISIIIILAFREKEREWERKSDKEKKKRVGGKCQKRDLRWHRYGRTSELQETPGEIFRRRCVTPWCVTFGRSERFAVAAAARASIWRRWRQGRCQRRRLRVRQTRFSRDDVIGIVGPWNLQGIAATQA